MARTWMTVTENHAHFGDWDTVRMPDYLPVTIFADSTGQYTEEEYCVDNLLEIPVPKDLLYQWWIEQWENGNKFYAEFTGDGLLPMDESGFLTWVWEESVADDTELDVDTLYDWLKRHNYFWKRLD